MVRIAGFKTAALATAAISVAALAAPAHAATTVVGFNTLNATALLPTPFGAGDTFLVDTTVTQQTGALSQSVTFTLGPDATSLSGRAVWEISTATGLGPRLIGVNIDIFDAGNSLVLSDTFAGTLGGFAISTLNGGITPGGTYRLVVTGTAVRDTVLDISISAVPEPGIYSLLLAGLGVVGMLARRRYVG